MSIMVRKADRKRMCATCYHKDQIGVWMVYENDRLVGYFCGKHAETEKKRILKNMQREERERNFSIRDERFW